MQLNNLQKLAKEKNKRVGRGNGSGKGKTAARGQKGQKARGSIRVDFEGGQLRLIKRLPFRRGVGNTKAIDTSIVKAGQLNTFKPGTIINKEVLVAMGLVKKNAKVKIVAGGELTVALVLEIPVTKTVKDQVTKAGGKVS